MKKRGQLTLFIIAGLLIIIGISLFFLFSSKPTITRVDTSAIFEYVEECLALTAKDGLFKLGEQGKIYPDIYVQSEDQKIAYFYYHGQGFFPTKTKI